MTNVNDLQSMERFIDKKIEPLNKQISMLQIELSGVKQQLILSGVSQQSELLTGFVRFERLQDYKYKLLPLSEKIKKYLASL